MLAADLPAAARAVAKAKRIVVLTGAGISDESGVPTYRDVAGSRSGGSGSGLWDGLRGTVAAVAFGSPLGWFVAPAMAGRLYVKRLLRPVAQARPNPAHLSLVELERAVAPRPLPVITQNVDGLHRAAGSRNVLEVHGTVRRHRCTWGGRSVHVDVEEAASSGRLPRCEECWFGAVRPDVVLFGERLPLRTWMDAYNRVSGLRRGDALIVIGTSAQVQPVSRLPTLALERGATVVEVNPETCLSLDITYQMDDGDGNPTASFTRFAEKDQLIHLQGKAGTVMPALVDAVKEEWKTSGSNQ